MKLTFLLFIPSLVSGFVRLKPDKRVRDLYVNTSCYGKDTLLTIGNVEVRLEGRNFIINATADLNKRLTDLRGELVLEKCRSKENPDSCEPFTRMKIDSACIFITTPLFTVTAKCFHPPIKCPIEKGHYTGLNCKADMSVLMMFPIDTYYWKATGTAFSKSTNEVFGCIHTEAYFNPKA